MCDYKEMYFSLFQAVEKVINMLVEAQIEAEDTYVNDAEHKLTTIQLQKDEIEIKDKNI